MVNVKIKDNLIATGTLGAGATTVTSLTDSGLTITRIPYASTAGLLVDSANLTFDGTALNLGGATGVKLSAASGILTIAGIGGTYNENLTIDFDGAATNTVYIGTGTGVTTLNLNAIGLTTTGSGRFDGGVGMNVAPSSTTGYGVTLTASTSRAKATGMAFTLTSSYENSGTPINSSTVYATKGAVYATGQKAKAYGSYNDVEASGNSSQVTGTWNSVTTNGGTGQTLYAMNQYLSFDSATVTAYGDNIVCAPLSSTNPAVNQIGIFIDWAVTGSDANLKKWAFYNGASNPYSLTYNAGKIFLGNGVVIGQTAFAPTAYLHIGAGTATAGTAPLKFTSGTNLTTAEAGAMEYDGTDLFFTEGTPTRQYIAKSAGKGLSVTITTAQLTALGAQGSMTFVNGVLTAQTQAT